MEKRNATILPAVSSADNEAVGSPDSDAEAMKKRATRLVGRPCKV